jgi:hypothetical protein
MTAGKAMALSAQARAEIDQAESSLREEIARFLEKTRSLEHVRNEGLAALRRQIVRPLLEREWQEVRQSVHPAPADQQRLDGWLQALQNEVLEHVELFQGGTEDEGLRLEALQDLLDGLRVNVVVDNHGLHGAPVVQEDNPSYRQLFGCIEYESDGEMLVTDFTRIRAGSLLRAHGGFLMLHLRDVLTDPPVWERLRRFVRCGRLQIEEPGVMYAPVAAVSLTPEVVQAEVKLVLIASPDEFDAVQTLDPELARRFRCKVDFADSFTTGPLVWRDTAVFVARTCARWGLPHFSAAAAALLIEDSHRLAQDQYRQSAVFAATEALVMESAALARLRKGELVQGIEQAFLRFVVAVSTRLARRLHIGGLDQLTLAEPGQGCTFHDQGFGGGEHGALAVLVLGQAVAVFDEQCRRRCRKVRQSPACASAGHKHSRVAPDQRPCGEAVGKIHLAAKTPRQFRVQRLHCIEFVRRSNQHQLDLGLHHLGRERDRRHRRVHHARFLDLQASATHKATQAFPHRRIGQYIAQVQHQKAAVRAQQAAGADAGEIGHQHLPVGFVFDATEQLPVRRVVLLHHWSAMQAMVIDHHVHTQAIEQVLQGLQAQPFIFGPALKQLHMLQHLVLERLQPAVQPLLISWCGVHRLTHFLPFALEQGTHNLATQGRQPFVAHMLERACLFKKTGDLFAQA